MPADDTLLPSPTAEARLVLSEKKRPRIVIIGAGFAGLACAKALKRADAEVVLVDRENHHCFQPLLYQVATATLAPSDIAWPIRAIVRRQENVSTLMSEVHGIDVERKRVITDAGELPFDYLVLAAGATHSYFSNQDWAAYAPGLKSIADAVALRRRVLLSFERAEIEAEAERQRQLLNFVIVGAGPTGVELAGAVAETAKNTLAKDFRRIDPTRARIVLLEAGPRILSAFPENLARYAAQALRKKGVEVLTETQVTACHSEGVETSQGAIAAANLIWAAGVEASPLAAKLGAAADKSGRVLVDTTLAVPGKPNVFVVGDAAAVKTDDGAQVPGVAPAAKQMGDFVGRLIAARLRGEDRATAFHYRHYGDLATIGRNDAVVRPSHGPALTGFLAWVFWSGAHIFFLISARDRFVVAWKWIWEYVTAQRGVRLIT